MAEKLEELQLPKAQVEIESRGAIYAVPFFMDHDLGQPSPAPEDAPGTGARHPPVDTSMSSGHPTSATPFPMAPVSIRQASLLAVVGMGGHSLKSSASGRGSWGHVLRGDMEQDGVTVGHPFHGDARAGMQRGATGMEAPGR